MAGRARWAAVCLRAVPQLLMVRRCVSRIDVIVRNWPLPPAYALLEVLIVMTISLER